MFYYCMVYTLLTTNDAIQITPGEREFTSNCVQIGNGLSGERPQLYTTTQSERVEYVLFIKLCHLKRAISSSSRKCIYILHRISVLLFRCLDVCCFINIEPTTNVTTWWIVWMNKWQWHLSSHINIPIFVFRLILNRFFSINRFDSF